MTILMQPQHVYLDDVTPMIDVCIAANKYPHILGVCEVKNGLAQLSSTHS